MVGPLSQSGSSGFSGRPGPPGPRGPADLPPVHSAIICVALPGLAISTDQGQLTGQGLEGFYRAGRRVLSRCQVRVAGREPLAVQARATAADRARFVATLRVSPGGGPDPDVVVERTRHADGTERITLHSAVSRPLRLPVEVTLGTDLAELGAIASGRAGPELPASVNDSGLRWSCAAGGASVTADPPPADALASAGLLRWEFDLPPVARSACSCASAWTARAPYGQRGARRPALWLPHTQRETIPGSSLSCARASTTSSPYCCVTQHTPPTLTSQPESPGAAAWLRPTLSSQPG